MSVADYMEIRLLLRCDPQLLVTHKIAGHQCARLLAAHGQDRDDEML